MKILIADSRKNTNIMVKQKVLQFLVSEKKFILVIIPLRLLQM